MDRHHDSDALTAYKHQMIQVYRPSLGGGGAEEEKYLSYPSNNEEDNYQ